MNIFKENKNLIPGIHNYCDRWCERCAFTARCSVYAMEQEDTEEERDINNEAFWRKLGAIFAQAQIMLREKAEEFGIDPDAISDEEFAEMRQRQDEKIESEDLTKLAERYVKEAQTLLDDKDEWLIFSLPDEEIQQELLSVIHWYHFFIAAKIHRGLHGIIDYDGNLDEEELNDSQSDANGSIKIALIAVERSIMAWTALMSAENASHIKPLLYLLEKIMQKAEERFPVAREFIRPGFDEVEIVM